MNTLSNLSVGVAPWLPPILFAPFIGSFLGLLIVRLPDGRPVLLARSACDRCGHTLAARDMVPFVSYLWCRGRCRYCGAAIGTFPFAVELAALTVVLWAVVSVADAELWWACLLGWTLLTLGWIDVRTMLLPDVLTLPLLAAGLVEAAIAEPDVLADHALAAVFGYLSLFAVAWFWRRFRGRDGLGMGDAKLLAAIGAWLGVAALPFVLLLAACLGLAAAGCATVAGRKITATTAIPFGPFLALAGWLLWLYDDRVSDWLASSAVGGWLSAG